MSKNEFSRAGCIFLEVKFSQESVFRIADVQICRKTGFRAEDMIPALIFKMLEIHQKTDFFILYLKNECVITECMFLGVKFTS